MARWIMILILMVTTSMIITNCYAQLNDDWTDQEVSFFDDLQMPGVENFFDFKQQVPPNCTLPEKINGNENMTCNFRGTNLPDFIFKWQAAHACYFYGTSGKFKENEKLPLSNSSCFVFHNERIYRIGSFEILTNGRFIAYPVDFNIHQVSETLQRTLVNFPKWCRCSDSSMNCCRNILSQNFHEPNNMTCPPVWDGWTCWDKQEVGIVPKQPCNEFVYTNQGPQCQHFSEKYCYLNEAHNIAIWNQVTNYSTCSLNPRLLHRNVVHVALLATSVAVCTPAIIILLAYKRLRCDRLAMHRNLLIFIVLRNIFLIVIKDVVIKDELTPKPANDTSPYIMLENGFGCRLLTTLEKFASSATFTCMLIDGILLHRRIVTVFKKALKPTLIYSIAAAITLLPVTAWIIVMSIRNDSYCWLVYFESGIQWILDAPRIAILVVNTALLIDILRVILTKLNRQENTTQLSTAKAALFLMPLFGVQFLITAWRPATDSCPWEDAYYIFTYAMESSQGILVAILYCYWNKEVHNLIKMTYSTTENFVSTHFTKSTGKAKKDLHNTKRQTCSTIVHNHNNDQDLSKDESGFHEDNEQPGMVSRSRSSSNASRRKSVIVS